MYDCFNSIGEFTGWSRTETDYFCHQLQTETIESGVSAYGMACARKDWDELVTGDMRAALGNPEGQCVRNCFVKTIGWAQANTFAPQMNFIFDTRPSQTTRDARVVFDAFKEWVVAPQLVGIEFHSSYTTRLLQVADMIAWELYQYANDILVDNLREPRRAQLKRLLKKMNFYAQIARRDSIEKIVAHWNKQDPKKRELMAKHFTYYDPLKPNDYSYLLSDHS
jgi:hypothetical protein